MADTLNSTQKSQNVKLTPAQHYKLDYIANANGGHGYRCNPNNNTVAALVRRGLIVSTEPDDIWQNFIATSAGRAALADTDAANTAETTIKLTPAQRKALEFLAKVDHAWMRNRTSSGVYGPYVLRSAAKALIGFGYATIGARNWINLRVMITDAGRAALDASTPAVPEDEPPAFPVDMPDVDEELKRHGLRRAFDGERGWYAQTSSGKVWATDESEARNDNR